MTEKQKRAWIIAALRRASMRWPSKTEAKKAARVGPNQYRCAFCGNIFPSKKIQMDHAAPVGRFINFDTFCDRLFCDAANYQALCHECHLAKTASERAA
jgi:5-methylcytosine-specific restriction endonuclease McrA